MINFLFDVLHLAINSHMFDGILAFTFVFGIFNLTYYLMGVNKNA